MSGSISVNAFAFGLTAALQGFGRSDNAISNEAGEVARYAGEINEKIGLSRALFGSKADAISDLLELAEECSNDNWNGEGAYSIDSASVSVAIELVHALPENVSLPEFAPEPDGSVSMDWICSSVRLLSVSASANRRLAFAWLDGSDKGHAVERFDGKRIPERLMREIRRI